MLEGPVSRRIKFTDRSLKAIKPPAKPRQLDYFDDSLPGFGLRVSYNGRKSWIVLYRCNGVKGRLTLSRFEVIPLVEAREKARQTACLSNMKQLGTGLTMYALNFCENSSCV